jgi:hypothetical protein
MPILRNFIAAITLLFCFGGLGSPSLDAAPDLRARCRNTCQQQYQFCLRSATTKAARNNCAIARKACRKGCVIPH